MTAAVPDTAADRVIEEILVTARRREELSIAVPMSLTRIDGSTLDGLQYHELDEFLSLSPGVLVYRWRRQGQFPDHDSRRGHPGRIGRARQCGLRRRDLCLRHAHHPARVLRHPVGAGAEGPQAGLYGRNTTGGAVLITTGQPTEELSARIDASYAQYDTREASGTLNLPLSEVLETESYRLVPG